MIVSRKPLLLVLQALPGTCWPRPPSGFLAWYVSYSLDNHEGSSEIPKEVEFVAHLMQILRIAQIVGDAVQIPLGDVFGESMPVVATGTGPGWFRLQVKRKTETLKRGWTEVSKWVFCTEAGTLLDESRVRKVFGKTMKAAGLPLDASLTIQGDPE